MLRSWWGSGLEWLRGDSWTHMRALSPSCLACRFWVSLTVIKCFPLFLMSSLLRHVRLVLSFSLPAFEENPHHLLKYLWTEKHPYFQASAYKIFHTVCSVNSKVIWAWKLRNLCYTQEWIAILTWSVII